MVKKGNCGLLLTDIWFFYLLFGCPTTNFGPLLGQLWAIIPKFGSLGGSLTNLLLITVLFKFLPKDHWEPCNKVGSLSSALGLVGSELENFQFYQNALTHWTIVP